MTASYAVQEWIRPLADGRLRLVGQRCRACGTHAFPRTSSCKRCSSADLEESLLGPAATLHALTVDRSSPAKTRHAIVGQARFDAGVYVQGYVVGDVDALPRIGEVVEVVRYEFVPFDDGELVATYGFRPAEGRHA